MKSVSLLLLATLVACSEAVPPAPPAAEPTPAPVATPVEPVVVAPAETPAKFKVGDAVELDGVPFAAKIVEVQGMVEWTNVLTGEAVVMRAYLVELTSPDGTETIQVRAPEIVITAKK